jgi:hypothetical protein
MRIMSTRSFRRRRISLSCTRTTRTHTRGFHGHTRTHGGQSTPTTHAAAGTKCRKHGEGEECSKTQENDKRTTRTSCFFMCICCIRLRRRTSIWPR